MVRAGAGEGEPGVRKGPWTLEEDLILISYVSQDGEGSWDNLARSAGLNRNGKSCRLRWLNYLRPGVRRGSISPEEDTVIRELHSRWGNKWSKIAKHLPGRTDNEVKNYWRTRIQKKREHSSHELLQLQRPDAMATSEAASTSSATTSQASSAVGDGYMETSLTCPDLSWAADDHHKMAGVGVITAQVFSTSEFSDNFWNVDNNFWETLPLSDTVYEALYIDSAYCCN